MTYAGPNKLKPGEKFLAVVWGPGGFYVTKRKGFITEDGALRFANKKVLETGVLEVAIMVKDKANRKFPWRAVHRVKAEKRKL